jgi:hypothetical protein
VSLAVFRSIQKAGFLLSSPRSMAQLNQQTAKSASCAWSNRVGRFNPALAALPPLLDGPSCNFSATGRSKSEGKYLLPLFGHKGLLPLPPAITVDIAFSREA